MVSAVAWAALALTNIETPTTATVAAQIALLLVGAGGFLVTTAPRSRRAVPPLLIAILLLAFALRWLDLGTAIRRHVDELHAVAAVLELQTTPVTPILVPYSGVPEFTRTFTVAQAASVEALGPSLTGLRFPSVLFGVLTVAATYALARALAGRRVALVAALTLAVFPPHVHFSRLALNNIADPLFGTLALALLIRRRWTAAGVMLGLTQYFYEGGRLLFPPLILASALILPGRRPIDLARLALTAAIVAAPVYVVLAHTGLGATPRLNAVSEGVLTGEVSGIVERVTETLGDAVGIIVWQPDAGWFYAGETALVLAPLVPFLLIGIGAALIRGLPLLLWLAATIIGGALMPTVESPRYVVAFPALAILIAWGLMTAWERLLAERMPSYRRAVAVVVLLVLAAGQILYYTRGHIPTYIAQYPQQTIVDDIRLRARTLPDNTHVLVVADFPTFSVDATTYMRFVGRLDDGVFIDYIYPGDLTEDHLRSLARIRNLAVFVAPEDADSLGTVRAAFPDVEPGRSPFPDLPQRTYWSFVVPRR